MDASSIIILALIVIAVVIIAAALFVKSKNESGDVTVDVTVPSGIADARRLATLLVSEIAMYHERQITAGRENKDLYKRLQSEIERARQTYLGKVGKTTNTQTDHFHDELVRVLADGDERNLGADYMNL